ncbi:MAG: putative Immunoglobulin I-set domain protein [Pedosphaera sp.]|nr:putative Immunoglobulin I-set domain protein [Pedosphaera sp.]
MKKRFLGMFALAALPVIVSAQSAYQSSVLSDNPKAYYRLNDSTLHTTINQNSGSLGSAGNATNDLSVMHPFPGAIVGDSDRSEFFDFAPRTEIPWNAGFNPPNTQPFTLEAWFYPASDQTSTGQCPIGNRFAWSGVQRQGWVFFQRKPSSDYSSGEPVGWNFRMYNENDGNGGLDVTSLVPYELGKWTHVAVIYDPLQLSNATVTMYINGVAANTNIWTGGSSGTSPGYVANSNNHPEAPASLAIGNYNNTAGTTLNPYLGAVDEFAFYSNLKLTAAQILSHYQNGTNANRSTPYDTLIKSANPAVYLRLNEIAPSADVAINMGDLRASGLATHTAEVRHPAPSALAGRTDDGAASYHGRNGKSSTTMPWIAENNPDSSIPFTLETWLRPMRDQQGGQAAMNNRWVGTTNRTGWVLYQRNPNLSYPLSEGHGWTFRMYGGSDPNAHDVTTDTDYNIGEWSHLVITWEPQTDFGDPGANGNHQFAGVLTAYFNGLPVASNTFALYAANRNPAETAAPAADWAIGSYNAASTLGNNPFEGDVDEVAFYSNYILSPEQVAAHYEAGTNAHPATNYETLVLTAPFFGPERQGPKTYLRFNDPAVSPVANSGTLGHLADGNLVLTANTSAGPRPAANGGFETNNTAVSLNGLKQWGSMNNPAGLNISGQITLEAWVQPGASQGSTARIISHGPPTLSSFLGSPPDGAVVSGNEVFLRISGANYQVGSSDGTTTNSASFPVPAGDLGGSSWIHLAGTYDGANWKLYRNGALVATAASAVGARAVTNADWAIGATGNGWADNFAGSIDEPAIYNQALSASRIATHYTLGHSGPGSITITKSGTTARLTWTGGGTLQEAVNANGPYTDLPAAVSPYTPTAGPAKKFYRLKY